MVTSPSTRDPLRRKISDCAEFDLGGRLRREGDFGQLGNLKRLHPQDIMPACLALQTSGQVENRQES